MKKSLSLSLALLALQVISLLAYSKKWMNHSKLHVKTHCQWTNSWTGHCLHSLGDKPGWQPDTKGQKLRWALLIDSGNATEWWTYCQSKHPHYFYFLDFGGNVLVYNWLK